MLNQIQEYSIKVHQSSLRNGRPPLKFIDTELSLKNNSTKDSWFVFSNDLDHQISFSTVQIRAIEVRQLSNKKRYFKFFSTQNSFIAFKVPAKQTIKISDFEFYSTKDNLNKKHKILILDFVQLNNQNIEDVISLEEGASNNFLVNTHNFSELKTLTFSDLKTPIYEVVLAMSF